jgi:GAF domain-containing protein
LAVVAPDDVSEGLEELASTLVAAEGLQASLARVARLAVNVVPRCDSASVSLATDGRVETTVATDLLAERVDEHQYRSGEGPCLHAIRTGDVVMVDIGEERRRWPHFSEAALGEGAASAYSLPLKVGDGAIGALNLYSRRASFGTVQGEAAEALARQAAVTLANAQAYHQARELAQHLEKALKSRDVIGQAKGIIMERERCCADQAFDVLRAVSQARNVKLREVAELVVLTGSWTEQ